MTDKRPVHTDEDDIPGSEIPGHRQDEPHGGVEAAVDTGNSLTDVERVALGIEPIETVLDNRVTSEPEASDAK